MRENISRCLVLPLAAPQRMGQGTKKSTYTLLPGSLINLHPHNKNISLAKEQAQLLSNTYKETANLAADTVKKFPGINLEII